jgi:predicted nuclease of predicted toxin-antitoxin system
MNLSPEWIDAFRPVGIDAVHWSTVGSPRADDAEIRGAIVSIDEVRARVRILPLR